MRAFLLISCLILSACSKKEVAPTVIQTKLQDGVVAEVAGVKLTERELMKGLALRTFDLEEKIYQMKYEKVEAFAIKALLEGDPKSKNLSNDEYFSKFIAPNLIVSNQDLESFMKERGIRKDLINEEMAQKVRDMMLEAKKKKAIKEWFAKETIKTPLKLSLERPQRPLLDVTISESDPAIGPNDAKVTVVQYIDFQCPFCAKGAEVYSKIEKYFGSKVRFVYKPFPLPFHPESKLTASIYYCAYKVDSKKVQKLSDELFKRQEILSEKVAYEAVQSVGLNLDLVRACVGKGEFSSKIDAEFDAAKALGIDSIPVYLVNGQYLHGAQEFEAFKSVIEAELSK